MIGLPGFLIGWVVGTVWPPAFWGWIAWIGLVGLLLIGHISAGVRFWAIGPGRSAVYLALALPIAGSFSVWRAPRPLADDLAQLAPLRFVRVRAVVATDPVQGGGAWRFRGTVVWRAFPRAGPAHGTVNVTWRDGPGGTFIGGYGPSDPAAIGETCAGDQARAGDRVGGGDRPRIGDLVLITGRLRSIREPSNPGEPDMRAVAARHGVFCTIAANQVAIQASGFGFLRGAADVRDRVVASLGIWASRQEAALIGSLIFGAGAVPVDEDTRALFTDLGLAHALAASGMQTTMLMRLVLTLGRYAGFKSQSRVVLATLAIGCFAAMAGFAPSILRATLMGAALLLADATDRRATGLRCLWISGLALLIWDPGLVFDLGFQFSFLATLGLLTTTRPIEQRLIALAHYIGRAADSLRAFPGHQTKLGAELDGSAKTGVAPGAGTMRQAGTEAKVGTETGSGTKAGRKRDTGVVVPPRPPAWLALLAGVISTPIAASIWCTPLQLATFGQLSAWSLPANWFAELLIVALTHIGFVFGALGLVWAPLAWPGAIAMPPLIRFMIGGLARLHELPWASFYVLPPSLGAAWIATIGIGLACWTALPRRSRIACSFGALAVLAIRPPPDRMMVVTVLDVGQGDAIAIRSPRGRWALVDGGPNGAGWDAGERVVLPFLRRSGCRRLDFLVGTHPHSDHVGGLPAVLAGLPVDRVWDSGQADESPVYRAFLATILTTGAVLAPVRRGNQLLFDGIELEVLAPDHPHLEQTHSDANNNGLAIRLRYNAFTMLLAADAEREAEAELVANARSQLKADVLKVPHHGSRFGSTPDFLAAVQPRASIVSVGKENLFGHPAQPVLTRLKGYGPVYRTDQDGAITLKSNGNIWSIEAYRSKAT